MSGAAQFLFLDPARRQMGAADTTQRVAVTKHAREWSFGVALRRIPLAVRMLFYSVFFLSAVLVGLPRLAYRIDVHLPSWHVGVGWFRLLGGALFIACLAVYIHATYFLTSCGNGTRMGFDPPQELVAAGPFRRVRNPVVICLVGMLPGEAVVLSSTGVLLLVLLSMPLAHLQAVLIEEPGLRNRFGRAYADYIARVPRWIPGRPRTADRALTPP